MQRLKWLSVCFLVLLASSALAQTLTIGPNYGTPIGSTNGGTVTAIDLGHPASGTGTVTSIRFDWSASPCTGAVKIKFFHPSGSQLTVIAERGPFNGSQANTNVAITPVNVVEGDLIGITQLTSCGNSTVAAPVAGTAGYLEMSSDPSGTFPLSSGTTRPNGTITVMGTGTVLFGSTVPALDPLLLALLAVVFTAIALFMMRAR
jgi:hypothetical protein